MDFNSQVVFGGARPSLLPAGGFGTCRRGRLGRGREGYRGEGELDPFSTVGRALSGLTINRRVVISWVGM